MAVLWLLLRVRWRQAWKSSLAVCLLIGGVGGFVMGSTAAARAVDSAYRALLEDIDAPDLAVVSACETPDSGTGCEGPPEGAEEDAGAEEASGDDMIESLLATGVVERAMLVEYMFPYFVDASGSPLLGTPSSQSGCGDRDGAAALVTSELTGANARSLQVRVDGDMPAAGSNGVVLPRVVAEPIGVDVGDHVRLAGWCDSDGETSEFEAPIDLLVSGLSVGPLDVEPPAATYEVALVHVDPIVFDAVVAIGAEANRQPFVWLDDDLTAEQVSDGLASFVTVIDLRERAQLIDDALATDALPLKLLAAIGAIGGLLVVAPVIGRHLRDTGPDPSALVAVGARPPLIARQTLVHALALALAGAVSAAIVAVPLAAVMPRGLAAAISSGAAVRIDWMVTGIGIAVSVTSVIVIGTFAALGIARNDRLNSERRLARRSGAPAWTRLRPAARTGVSAAVGSPAGPRRASPWPSLISMMVVATAGVASVTYLAGLRHLEATPSVVGWNWDASIAFDFDQDVPASTPDPIERLMAIEGIEQVTPGFAYPVAFLAVPDTDISFVWPWAFATGPQAITPTMLSGRAPTGPAEVAIDHILADQTGLTVGDVISFERQPFVAQLADYLQQEAQYQGVEGLVLAEHDDQPMASTFEITGIAVLPLERNQEIPQATFTLLGYASFVEPTADELATARSWLPADLPVELQPTVDRTIANFSTIDEHPSLYNLRFSDDPQSAREAIATLDGVDQFVAPKPDEVLSEIIRLNVDRSDRVPIALAGTVAALFAALTCYLLFASVSIRRFELALMRSLGMSTAGVRRSVAAQATATAALVLIVAIPAGVPIGRWAWLAYARDLAVLPVSVIPWATLAVAAGATLVVANVAALTLGWRTTTRSPGPDLRSE